MYYNTLGAVKEVVTEALDSLIKKRRNQVKRNPAKGGVSLWGLE